MEKWRDREDLIWGSPLPSVLLSQGRLDPQGQLARMLPQTHTYTHPLIFSLSSPLRIVLMDDAMDCLMSFSDFLFAFQIQFYYSGESLPGPLWLLSGPRALSYPVALSIGVPGACTSPLLPPWCASQLVTHQQDV